MNPEHSEAMKRVLARTPEDVIEFIRTMIGHPIMRFGTDTETSSLDYPDGFLAGFSLYCPGQNAAIYVPVKHEAPINVPMEPMLPALNWLFKTRTAVAHGWHHDGPFLLREGVEINEIACTLAYSNMLQAQNAGLKDQALEHGIVKFAQVISYRTLLAEVKGLTLEELEAKSGKSEPESLWGFHTVDVSQHERALHYACDDPSWAYWLGDKLVRDHDELIGNPVWAAAIRAAQDDSLALLAEAAGRGYVIDSQILAASIAQAQNDIEAEEVALMGEVRELMGWNKPPEPAPAVEEGVML